jgi:hypothetical protein
MCGFATECGSIWLLTLDREILLSIAREKFRNRFFCDASHHIHAPIYFPRIGFQPSHRSVIWLSRFG